MKRGYLSEYFSGVAMKRLSAVEADRTRSNQHEYNANKAMMAFMKPSSSSTTISSRFMYLDDEHEDPVIEDAFLTLYDSRKNQPHRSAEYRFYFPTTRVSLQTCEGDLLLIAKRRHDDEGLLVVVAKNGSNTASQLEWLFGTAESTRSEFAVRQTLENEHDRVGWIASTILESIGIEVEPQEQSHLDVMLARFGGKFPKTAEFSAFARETLHGIEARDAPDVALMAWMEREEVLFRTLERHIIGQRLADGFSADDIDDFIQFSLSVQNRRKSRVGLALENHMEVVFTAQGVRYQRTAITENKSKPDFLFPGATQYHSDSFNANWLSMLAVKSTCKDRWRQALAEADRITKKHLLTLEPAISTNQTLEMQHKHLQLVVPQGLHATYTETQRQWLFSLADFSQLVLDRQRRSDLV